MSSGDIKQDNIFNRIKQHIVDYRIDNYGDAKGYAFLVKFFVALSLRGQKVSTLLVIKLKPHESFFQQRK